MSRGNLVVFDECGFLDEELMSVYAAFTIVNKDLKMGGDIDAETIKAIPKEIPNQLLYISSASSVDTPFYKKYRDFSKQMLLGDPNYFVAEINCDVAIKGTVKGKVYPASLLSQETVDLEMRNNREKALREYYCQFSTDGGEGAIIKRGLITRNSIIMPPVLANDGDPKRRFVMAYDPARSLDNSVIGVGELILDEEVGWTMNIVNCVNFADLSLKKKTPKTTPEQIKQIKRMLLDYSGGKHDVTYDCIETLMIDAGRGGAGVPITDFFMEDWVGEDGKTHRGLIDKEYNSEYVKKFPNAVNKIRLLEPSKYKSEMFESLIKMVEGDFIKFTETYDNRGFISIIETDQKAVAKLRADIKDKLVKKKKLSGEELEEAVEKELAKANTMTTRKYNLTQDEELALVQIDAMKEEIVNICRTPRESGKDSFKLPPHKDATTGASESTLYDDRALKQALFKSPLIDLDDPEMDNRAQV